jgi:hypothetical protein
MPTAVAAAAGLDFSLVQGGPLHHLEQHVVWRQDAGARSPA